MGRELGGDYSFEAAYVGRTGRNQMIRRDLAMPLDFVDKKSGVDYFTAAKQMIDAMHASGDPLTIAPIPYWENVFPERGLRDGPHRHAEHGRARSARTSPTG